MILDFTTFETKPPVFGDVDENQFFVDRQGRLCQKSSSSYCAIIANRVGTPLSTRRNVGIDEQIERVLPHTNQIKF